MRLSTRRGGEMEAFLLTMGVGALGGDLSIPLRSSRDDNRGRLRFGRDDRARAGGFEGLFASRRDAVDYCWSRIAVPIRAQPPVSESSPPYCHLDRSGEISLWTGINRTTAC